MQSEEDFKEILRKMDTASETMYLHTLRFADNAIAEIKATGENPKDHEWIFELRATVLGYLLMDHREITKH